MSRVYVDTSAFVALLIESDESHETAGSIFNGFRHLDVKLVTSSYVLVECYALLGKRVGAAAVKGFREKMQPLLDVIWVDEELHELGLNLLEAKRRRNLSLVDAVSFAAMRKHSISTAFTFDKHFAQEGFVVNAV